MCKSQVLQHVCNFHFCKLDTDVVKGRSGVSYCYTV